MGSAELANLAKIGSLRAEPPDQREFDALVASARRSLADRAVPGISTESRFLLTYEATHSLAVAALRWNGYRSNNRYLVFQCLGHTLGIADADWRVLNRCHDRRNVGLYEGLFDIEDALASDQVRIAQLLLGLVSELGPVR